MFLMKNFIFLLKLLIKFKNNLMISYYGGKSKIAKHYPAPIHDTIIEPFAGFAQYSLLYFEKDVILYELYEKVFKIWKYLQKASIKDIMSLPDAVPGFDLRTVKTLSEPERWLIGYQGNRGAARPNNIMSKRSTWLKDRTRIANDLYKIKHWKILQKDAMTMPLHNDVTYFIDPPYTKQSHGYNYRTVDYSKLKGIIDSLNTQVIVCGNQSDLWTSFKPLIEMQGTNKKHIECVYLKNC